jgi:hypothetical protein
VNNILDRIIKILAFLFVGFIEFRVFDNKSINATTLQKIHPGTPVGTGEYTPDASFENYSELRILIKEIIDNE